MTRIQQKYNILKKVKPCDVRNIKEFEDDQLQKTTVEPFNYSNLVSYKAHNTGKIDKDELNNFIKILYGIFYKNLEKISQTPPKDTKINLDEVRNFLKTTEYSP